VRDLTYGGSSHKVVWVITATLGEVLRLRSGWHWKSGGLHDRLV